MKRLLIWLAIIALVLVFRQYGSFFGANDGSNNKNTPTETLNKGDKDVQSYNPNDEAEKTKDLEEISQEQIKNVPANLVNQVIEQKQAQNQIVESGGVATISIQDFMEKTYPTPAPKAAYMQKTPKNLIQNTEKSVISPLKAVIATKVENKPRNDWKNIKTTTPTPQFEERAKISSEINTTEQGTKFDATDFEIAVPKLMYEN